MHLGGSLVNSESFLTSMMGDPVEANDEQGYLGSQDCSLDETPVHHFERLDDASKEAELDKFQASQTSRKKVVRTAN